MFYKLLSVSVSYHATGTRVNKHIPVMYWAQLLSLIVILLHCNGEIEDGISYLVKPGAKDCFFRDLKVNDKMNLEVQVISGGEIDITVTVISPSGTVLLNEVKQTEVSKDIDITEEGAHEICFDNTFSVISEKVVYFDLGIDQHNGTSLDHLELIQGLELGKDNYENVKEITASLDIIGLRFEIIQEMQALFRSRYKRHAYLLNANLSLVTWFSSASCALMVFVGVLQVYLIRSFFTEKTTKGMQSRL